MILVDFEQKLLVSRKLRQMWKGQLVMVVAGIILLVTLLIVFFNAVLVPLTLSGGLVGSTLLMLAAAVAALVGQIIYWVGLYGLREIQPEYRTAFRLCLVNIIISLVSDRVEGESLLGHLLDTASSVLSLAVLWLVLQATNRIMEELGRQDVVQVGRTMWGLNLICTAVNIASGFIPVNEDALSGTLAWTVLLLAAAGILGTAADLLVLKYLGQGADVVRDSV